MTADFNWFLNKQGPRGQQGIRGEQGFSPVITVAENTAKAYILRIQTQDDTFLTPNLRGTVEDLGGTYVRYNPETGQVYAGSPDVATTETFGVIRLASAQDVTDRAQDAAITPDLLANQIEALDLPNNYVTINTAQTINALKAFRDGISLSSVRNLDGAEVLDFLSGTPYKIKTWGNGLSIQGGLLRIENGSIKSKSAKQPSTDTNVYDVVTSFDLATTESAGIVKPDGSTVFIDENGVISAKSSEIDDASTSTQSTWSSSKINTEISTVAQKVVDVQSNVASLDADVSTLKPIVESHTTSISSINDSIAIAMSDITELKEGKQDKLTAGNNITIEGNVISATGGAAPENMVTTDTTQEITGSKLFSNGLKVGGYAGISDNNGEQFICVDPSHNGWTIGCQNSGGWFSNVHIKRGASGDYINIDSGNISEYMPDNVVTEDNLAAQPVIQELQSALTESYDLLPGNGITISENTATKTTTISLITEFAFKHIVLTQAEYDALTTKDNNTMYIIVG